MYVLSDFRVGEAVVLVNNSRLIFTVRDIDKEHGLIICSVAGIPEVAGRFKPEELKKVKESNSPDRMSHETSEE